MCGILWHPFVFQASVHVAQVLLAHQSVCLLFHLPLARLSTLLWGYLLTLVPVQLHGPLTGSPRRPVELSEFPSHLEEPRELLQIEYLCPQPSATHTFIC